MESVNQDIIIAVISGTLILLISSSFGVIFAIIYKKKQQAYEAEKRLMQNDFQEALLQSQLEIQEQTLQHISSELHDNIGQIASLIKIHLSTIQLDDRKMSEDQLENAKGLLRDLIFDVKSLSKEMNSDRISQLGIMRGIQEELEKLTKTQMFEVKADFEGNEPDFSSSQTIIVFRMVQEIINNIIKHSEARKVVVSLLVDENLFKLVVADDGNGFDLEQMAGVGSGLINLKNRARLLQADFSIESGSGKGTTCIIKVPLKNQLIGDNDNQTRTRR